jgi:DNA-binding transcriptional LysR family regulator
MRRYDWNDLRFFLEVARQGTLSGAAKVIGTDHATVSRRIDALERALEQRLFARSQSGYALTPSGTDLLPLAEQVETLALQSASAVGGGKTLVSGVVRLITPDGFGNFFLAQHLPRFVADNPRLQVQLVTVQQVQANTQREGDIVVTLAPPQRSRMASEKLADYSLGLYVASNYFDTNSPIETRQDLREHRFVGYVDDLIFTRELDYLNEILPGVRAQIQSSSLTAQVTAVRRGGGVGVLPNFIAAQMPDLQRVLFPMVELQRSYWLNTAAGGPPVARIEVVKTFLREIVANDPNMQRALPGRP